jgi:hypothetical protein
LGWLSRRFWGKPAFTANAPRPRSISGFSDCPEPPPSPGPHAATGKKCCASGRRSASIRRIMPALRTFNVESGMPALDEARRRVIEEIRRAKREGIRVLKVIHGYGSTGKGGKLNFGLRKSFALRKQEGVIKDFIPGEDFSIFNGPVLTLLEVVPELRGDPDLDATNEGVTLLWLK